MANDLTILLQFLPNLNGKSILQVGYDQDVTRVFEGVSPSKITVVSGSEHNQEKAQM